MKYTFLPILLTIFLFHISGIAQKNPVKVKYKGALMNIMHKGDISAKASLEKLEKQDHIYALGAVENLKGEILILDSKPFISSCVKNKELTINHSFKHNATLLVYASVEDWKSISIPENVSTYKDLENYIEKIAEQNGINTEKPFPFRIEGIAKSFDWHVIDWKEGDMEHSHEKHVNSGLHGTKQDMEIQILGFYSKHHHRIFTHHMTNMHLHFKTTEGKLSGHIDELSLSNEMTLKIPKN